MRGWYVVGAAATAILVWVGILLHQMPGAHGATRARDPVVVTREPPRPAVEDAPRATPPSDDDGDEEPAYHGVVIDRATGKPIDGAAVFLCRGGDAVSCQEELVSNESDEEGEFRLFWPPNGGVVDDDEDPPAVPDRLLVQLEGYAPLVVDGAALASALTPGGAHLALSHTARIHGVVRDDNGPVTHEVQVAWERVDATVGFDNGVATNTQGEFEIDGVLPGEILIHATDNQPAEELSYLATARVTLAPGEDRDVALVLGTQPLKRVTARVVDETGRGLAMVRVTAKASDGSDGARLRAAMSGDVMSTPSGEFTWDLVGGGVQRVQLWAWDDNAQDLLGEGELDARTDAEQTLVVRGAPVRTCRLVDQRGAPLGVDGYSLTWQKGDEELGMSSGGSFSDDATQAELHFVWPPRATAGTLTLHHLGRSVETDLAAGGDCELSIDTTGISPRRGKRVISLDEVSVTEGATE